MENSVNMSVFSIGVLFLVSSLISVQSSHVGAVEFAPVPFDRIPVARVSSDNGGYNLTADFSIDFGDEAVAIKNNDTDYVNNMTLNMEDNGLSFGVECDSNDECGTGLSPTAIKIYLVDNKITDIQIVENSVPSLEIGYNDCGSLSVEDCANFNFYIPSDILVQKYKIVAEMSFDEAKWIFINPVEIQ